MNAGLFIQSSSSFVTGNALGICGCNFFLKWISDFLLQHTYCFMLSVRWPLESHESSSLIPRADYGRHWSPQVWRARENIGLWSYCICVWYLLSLTLTQKGPSSLFRVTSAPIRDFRNSIDWFGPRLPEYDYVVLLRPRHWPSQDILTSRNWELSK